MEEGASTMRTLRYGVGLGLAIGVLSVWAGSAWAQTSTQGGIVGTITDQSNAVLPGATVVVTNVNTGISSETTTNASGDYRFNFLQPGEYSVTADLQGFSTAETAGVIVTVGSTARVDQRLEVGARSETVTVVSTAPILNTEDASRGEVITAEAIQHVPLNGREFIELMALAPGATSGNSKRGAHDSRGVAVGFNGARVGYNAYYIDGARSTDPLYNQLQSSPALDAISEFRVETNMYSAQYGRAGGAMVSVITKSGTNQLHGTMYEYYRGKELDALPFLYEGSREELDDYHYHQFGGTAGGPIWKNRTFYFVSGEMYRQQKPGSLIVSFAPSALERSGDVSQTINPYTGEPVVLTNPYTGEVIPSGVLPPELINPVGQQLMDLWPEPNFSGDPFLNLHLFRGGTFDQNKWLTKVNHRFSTADSISGVFDFNDYDNTNPGHTIYGDKVTANYNRTVAGTWTHTFGPRLVNDLKASYSRYFQGTEYALNDKNYCADWGFDPTTNTLPGTCRILNYTIGSQRFDIGNDGDFKHRNRSLYLKDSLVWVTGNHTLLFGGEFQRELFSWQYNSGSSAYYVGLLDGSPGLDTTYLTTGSVFTDLLAGLPNRVNIGLGGTAGPAYMNFSRNSLAFYVQDDWKVNESLTLNLGLRYDYEAPFSQRDDLFMTLDFETGLPTYAEGVPQELLEIVRFPYATGGPNRPFEPNALAFAPRAGFAWRLSDRTVARGGYGIFHTSETAFTTMYGSWVAPFQGLVTWSPKAQFWPDEQDHWVTFDQPTYRLDYVRGASPGTFFANTPDYPRGYLHQWNFTVGRDLGNRSALEIGYVGSHGTDLNGPMSIQTYSPELYEKLQALGLANFSLRAKGFSSSHHALQTSFRANPAPGADLRVAYTWGHSMAQASNDDANENLVTDVTALGIIVKKAWTNADFDVRHRFTIAGGYALPFGRGLQFGGNWNPLVDAVLGGWRVNGLYTLQTGFPFTVYNPSLRLPDRTCDGNLPNSERTIDRWFDFSCFPTRPPSTVVDPDTGQSQVVSLHGDASPNIIRGPGINNVDLNVEKTFALGSRMRLQLRVEAFNLFNTPQYIGPSANYFFNSESGARITQARQSRNVQLAARVSF